MIDIMKTLEKLKSIGHPDVEYAQTFAEAEAAVAEFYDQYTSEWHPAKDTDGFALYDFFIENFAALLIDPP